MPSVDETKITGGGRICFRGDSRSPWVVFSRGMKARNTESKISLREGGHEPIAIHKAHKNIYQKAGLNLSESRDPAVLFPASMDVSPESSVCVTARLIVAAMFPLKMLNGDRSGEETWIYAVYARSLFNTHSEQITQAMDSIANEIAVRRKIASTGGINANRTSDKQFERYAELKALSLLYAQELATKAISARDVLCAIKCTRSWDGESWTDGGTYTLNKASLVFNPVSRVPRTVSQAVRAFMEKEPVTGKLPKADSGFRKSDPHHRFVELERRIQSLMAQLSQR